MWPTIGRLDEDALFYLRSRGIGDEAPYPPEEAIEVLKGWRGHEVCEGLPSAPDEPLIVRAEPDRPQARKDVFAGGGMATVVGRVREDRALPNGIKLVLLSHNTKMGASKGATLLAEYLVQQGLA